MASIPPIERRKLADRLEAHARTAWDERFARVNVRFRGEYAYVDALESNP